jgi:hypothetical protein
VSYGCFALSEGQVTAQDLDGRDIILCLLTLYVRLDDLWIDLPQSKCPRPFRPSPISSSKPSVNNVNSVNIVRVNLRHAPPRHGEPSDEIRSRTCIHEDILINVLSERSSGMIGKNRMLHTPKLV